MGKKIYVYEGFSFLKTYFYCQSQEIFFKHHLQMICLREMLHGEI